MERQISESCIDDIAKRVANILFEDEVDEGIMDTIKGVVKGLTPEKKKTPEFVTNLRNRYQQTQKPFPVGKKEYNADKTKHIESIKRVKGLNHDQAKEYYERMIER